MGARVEDRARHPPRGGLLHWRALCAGSVLSGSPPGATLDGSGEQPWLEGVVSWWREAASPSPRIETERTHHKMDKPDDSLPSAKLVCCSHQET